jgi:hypothetical protein
MLIMFIHGFYERVLSGLHQLSRASRLGRQQTSPHRPTFPHAGLTFTVHSFITSLFFVNLSVASKLNKFRHLHQYAPMCFSSIIFDYIQLHRALKLEAVLTIVTDDHPYAEAVVKELKQLTKWCERSLTNYPHFHKFR